MELPETAAVTEEKKREKVLIVCVLANKVVMCLRREEELGHPRVIQKLVYRMMNNEKVLVNEPDQAGETTTDCKLSMPTEISLGNFSHF